MAQAGSAQARFSLRALLYGTVGSLGAMLLMVVGSDCAGDWQRSAAAAHAVAVADATRDAFAALQTARLERGPLRDGLLAPDPVSQAEIDRLRHIHDPLSAPLNALITACARLDCDAGPGGADLSRGRDVTDGARQAAVPDLNKPMPDRRPRAAAIWYEAASQLVDVLEKTSGVLTGELRGSSPLAARLAQIKDAAYVARDGIGMSRTPLVAAAQGGRLTPELHLELTRLQSQAKAAWNVALAAGGKGVPASVTQAMNNARDTYFKRLGDASAEMTRALAAGQPSPYSPIVISGMVDMAANAMMAVADTALKAIADHARVEQAATSRSAWIDLGVLLLGALIAGAACMLIARGALRPVALLVDALGSLARRNYDFTLPATRAREIRAMVDAIATCREGLREADALSAGQAAEQTAKSERTERLSAALRRFETEAATALQAVADTSRQLDSTASDMEAAATEGAEHAVSIAERSSAAAAATGAAASGTDELSGSVSEISRQVEQAASIARVAVEETQRTDQAIGLLGEAAGRIGSAVQLISDIAGQTNLLSL